ncbi:MAG: GFA family protein [Luteolibacter sp.]|uniref:GFA family protein n=1 Tax=Luteolibacter sp. TaxID=1962973 RepID=UPI0032656932
MNLPITGGCHCGAVRYESHERPILMLKCHCRDCQRITGGPYVPAVIFPYQAFRVTRGEIRRHATDSENGGHNLRGFCAACGSRLTGAEDPERGMIGVVASSLDDPGIFQSQFDMYVEDAQPWDVLDSTSPKYPGRLPNRNSIK